MFEIETDNRAFPLQKRMPKYLASAVEEMKQKALIIRECSPDSLMDFGIGNPGQEVPGWILDTMIEEAGKIGSSGYMPSHGIPELRESISSWYLHRYGVSLDFEQEAVVTIGSKEGISHLALALVRAGDTVIVPDPAYPIHAQGFEIAGANIRRVPLQTPAQFLFDLEEEIVKGPGRPIRALVLNFPCNPSGCCVELSFFEKIVELAVKHSFWVIHDFAYADLVFDEYRAPSILQVQGAKEIAVEFFTMSKSYNMAGWRVGFMCGNAKLVAALKQVKPYFDYGMYRPIQYAASVALKYGGHYVAQVRDTYQRRRDVLVAGLHSCGWDVSPPQGGMFVWARIPSLFRHLRSLDYCQLLLNESGVVVFPGIGFGPLGDEFVRFSLIQNEVVIGRAIDSIRTILCGDGHHTDVDGVIYATP